MVLRRLRFLARIIPQLAAIAGQAQPAPEPGFCDSAKLEPARVAGVSDLADITLEGGAVLRLAGIDTASADSSALLEALRAGLPAGASVLFNAPSGTDRWGRRAARIYLPPEKAGEPPDWIQGVIAAKGLARVWPEPGADPCWKALAATEAIARFERRGLWQDGDIALRPDEKERLMSAAGSRMTLVGRITGANTGRATVFVNFGYSRDGIPSLRMPRRLIQPLQEAGLDISHAKGTIIRVRGIVTLGRQLFIDIGHIGQIEVVR